MFGMGLRETGLPVKRLDPHLPHEGAHVAPAYVMALVPKLALDARVPR